MGRGNFTITNVTRQTYVCSDHFDENVVLDYRLVSIFFLKSSYAFLTRKEILSSYWLTKIRRFDKT